MWSPSDWRTTPRDTLLYGCTLKLENNPFAEVLQAPLAIPFDGLPTGPLTMPGGPRAFGPDALTDTGIGYFNINTNSVRMHLYCNWDEMSLDQIDPYALMLRPDYPYPDESKYDDEDFVPVAFLPSGTNTSCTDYRGFPQTEYEIDYTVGEIPEEPVTKTITFDNMHTTPVDFYVDRYTWRKFLMPHYFAGDPLPGDPPSTPNAIEAIIYKVYWNSQLGQTPIPILSVPKSEVVWPATPRVYINRINIDYATNGPPLIDTLPDRSTLLDTGDSASVYRDMFWRPNNMPGYKITTPWIADNPHQGRTITETLSINCSAHFNSGEWTVQTTVDMLCDAEMCHYYTLPTAAYKYVHPLTVDDIGDEPCYPLLGGDYHTQLGWPGFYWHGSSSIAFGNFWFKHTVVPDWWPAGFVDFHQPFQVIDPTTGCYVKIYKSFTAFEGGGIEADYLYYKRWDFFAIPPQYRDDNTIYSAWVDSIEDGQTVAIDRTPMSQITDSNFIEPPIVGFPVNTNLHLHIGKRVLPAFLATQTVDFTFLPVTSRAEIRSRNSVKLGTDITFGFGNQPAEGYIATMTEDEAAQYRLPDDPVSVDLLPTHMVHTVTTEVAPATAVVDGLAVCFHTSWGGSSPRYAYQPNTGPVKTETSSGPGATIVRDRIT